MNTQCRMTTALLVLLSCALACEPDRPLPDIVVVDANFNPHDAGPHDVSVADTLPIDVDVDDTSGERDVRPDRFVDDSMAADTSEDAAVVDAAVDDIRTDATAPDSQTQFDASSDDAGIVSDCRTHTFVYFDAQATSVWVTGSFTNWGSSVELGALALTAAGDGFWTRTEQIQDIGQVQYKFVIDGSRWVTDPSNAWKVDDGFNNINSVIELCTCGDIDSFDWRDAVLYFALVDRFFDSDNSSDPVDGASDGDALTGPSGQYEGGDLAGVTQKLGYLDDLGVTALWISAPYDNRDSVGEALEPDADTHFYSAYHGYWPSPADIDYSEPLSPSPQPVVESRIGTDADLHDLVDGAHNTATVNGHGMRVLFDYVMNHVDNQSGFFAQHSNWFVDPVTLCGPGNLWNDEYWGTRCAFTSYLPAFNFYLPEARTWSINDAVWWAHAYNIDGYRLDAIKHVPMDWLTELRTALSTQITTPTGAQFYLVGETFDYWNPATIKGFVDPATKLDGQFDFPFKRLLCDSLFKQTMGLDAFAAWVGDNDRYYGENAVMTTWIGNHDIPRAIHFANNEIGSCDQGSNTGNSWSPQDFVQPSNDEAYDKLGLAFAVMLTGPGIPLIYYGDEVGLAGGGDPDNRRMMPWNDNDLSPAQLTLRSRVRALARFRGQHPVLGRGQRFTLSSSANTWVYRMSACGVSQDVTVALNRGADSASVLLPPGSYTEVFSASAFDGGSLVLGPREIRVYVSR